MSTPFPRQDGHLIAPVTLRLGSAVSDLLPSGVGSPELLSTTHPSVHRMRSKFNNDDWSKNKRKCHPCDLFITPIIVVNKYNGAGLGILVCPSREISTQLLITGNLEGYIWFFAEPNMHAHLDSFMQHIHVVYKRILKYWLSIHSLVVKQAVINCDAPAIERILCLGRVSFVSYVREHGHCIHRSLGIYYRTPALTEAE